MTDAMLSQNREAAQLVMDTFETIPAPALVRLHGDPEQPVPVIGDGFPSSRPCTLRPHEGS
jgi:hypothetical protein